MQVQDLVKNKHVPVVTIAPYARLGEAVRLLLEHGVGGLAVVKDGGELAGFISERDIVDATARSDGDVREVPVSQVMKPPPTCSLEEPISAVMLRMTRDRLRHLVAVDGGRVAGIISVGDIVKHRLEELELETGVLRDYVAARRAI